jgi:hypothetical protein
MQGTLGFADLLVGAGEEYSTRQSEILTSYTCKDIRALSSQNWNTVTKGTFRSATEEAHGRTSTLSLEHYSRFQ